MREFDVFEVATSNSKFKNYISDGIHCTCKRTNTINDSLALNGGIYYLRYFSLDNLR